jgi:hypothetical protein
VKSTEDHTACIGNHKGTAARGCDNSQEDDLSAHYIKSTKVTTPNVELEICCGCEVIDAAWEVGARLW